MPTRALRPNIPGHPPPVWWGLFASWLALTEPEGGRLWRQVSTSRHPLVRAWVVTAVYAAGYVGGREQAVALLAGPLAPQRVIAVLEVLVAERKLTRAEANVMEDAILTATTRSGAWT
jgi:hypothetical protein